MYKNILVPMALDHDISPRTLEIAHALSEDGAKITALHVYEAPQGVAAAYLDADTVKNAYERAKAKLHEKTAGIAGLDAQIVQGHTYRTIIDYAGDKKIDCIVIGSHKPGLSDYLLGSTAARVVRHAPCAVHVHRSS
ncbi:Nucleotide-binding universal stress protein, UspA family [Cognatiyoonia koreensis]|uniref:Nucleotide-binding universal stress protein, UspA family n=1 Tax=Cognatiyoonia koreensis TaxID=364200 RepID=A0A1I0RZM6_9RHOB|nr:universal stress protein [Cognatiyoonia koreensis]SEW47110.1 Nucleotide-binding universal stress protein, UspA family [Cognatiyoonia koreensis]